MLMIVQQQQALEAFCQVCPEPQEVTVLLAVLGFRLAFQLPAYQPSATSEVAPLPTQFHYERPDGMSVIYLAGVDRAEHEEERFPPHASRWWAYAGSDPSTLGQVTRVLALKWSCAWRRPSQECQGVAEQSRAEQEGETHVEADS